MQYLDTEGFEVRLLNDPEAADGRYAGEEPARAAFVENLNVADVPLVEAEYGPEKANHVYQTWQDMRRCGTAAHVDNGGFRALLASLSAVRCARSNARMRTART